jgi:hypothetical protein
LISDWVGGIAVEIGEMQNRNLHLILSVKLGFL